MMKYIFCCLAFLGISGMSFSQTTQDTLLVVPGKSGLYFYHIVNAKETLYSLSRDFRVDVKKLAAFNHLTLKSQLQLYQLIKIPLNNRNMDQSATASAASGLVPLYHKVIGGETLYHIGQMHDSVSAAVLRQWNHLPGKEVTAGQYLVVGWLKAHDNGRTASDQPGDSDVQPAEPADDNAVQNEPVATAKAEAPAQENTAGTDRPPGQNATPPSRTGTAVSEGGSFLNEVIAAENENRRRSSAPGTAYSKPPVQSGKPSAVSGAPAVPAVQQPEEDAFSVQTAPAVKEAPEVRPEAEKPAPEPGKTAVKKDTVKKDNAFASMLKKITKGPQNKPEQPKKVLPPATATEQKQDTPGTVAVQADTAAFTTVKSEFAALYDRQTAGDTKAEAKKGAAGWFRSNVKPGSGRYYALCDGLPRGTIVKVTNPVNHRYIFVKVLDAIPKQKENYNLLIKISDAAMGDLGVSQSRFWCEIRYKQQD